MKPEQREELKQAARRLYEADESNDTISAKVYTTITEAFFERVTSAAILSLIAQVEAYQADAELNAACVSAFHGESLDEKALNALLWFYRRAEHAYGRLPFAEEAITGLRARIVAAPTIPAIPGTKEGA